MKSPNNLLLAAVLALNLAAPGHAVAHGDRHAAKASPMKMEQQDWGIAADIGKGRIKARTVVFTMSDAMRFTPDTLDVALGETLRIVVRNDGKMLHEFVLGTKKELDAHAALMLKFPDMEHDEPWMAHVPPGQSSEIAWTFNRAGEFDFACLIAGHYQAGMTGRIKVAGTGAAPR